MGNNFVFDKSFQLLRTNPLLTTNLQVVVNSSYRLFLETLNSNKQLSVDRFKHFSLSKESYYESKIPLFYEGFPTNLAFAVKYDQDQSIMYDKYEQQFDEIYWAGANKIQDQWHAEEYEYFAPLYLRPEALPTNFIILRVDDPVVFKTISQEYYVDALQPNNFRAEIIDNWRCVTNFDLTYQSDLGYWLDRNFVHNPRFPQYPFEVDVKPYNFSRWHGIDYQSGVYTEKNMYLKDKLWYENPHFNLERFITEGWKTNDLIFPNILNLKFLFDDTPATPFKYRKYTINRYYGFYAENMTLVKTFTSYIQPQLRTNLKLQNNIFMDVNAITGSTMPFEGYWDDQEKYWLYANNDLYKVYRQEIINPDGSTWDQYGIISDYKFAEDMSDFLLYRQGEAEISFEQTPGAPETYRNRIRPTESDFSVDTYYDEFGAQEMYGDLYLIKIDTKYHVLKYNNIDDYFYIQTDYGIRSTYESLKYWIINENTQSTEIKMTDVLSNDDRPISFGIYRVKFADIRDFDFNRVNSHYADFDFEQPTYETTLEHKIYTTEHMDDSYPKSFKVYPVGLVNENQVVIVSSEYVGTDELYEISKQGLSEIWHKNPTICKWGFMGSNSHADYPYKFNNNCKVGSYFNRTTDPLNLGANPINKNLDYFLRIGSLYDQDPQAITNYLHQALYVETETYREDPQQFNLDYYIGCQFDYFDYYFKNTRYKNLNQDQDGHLEQTTKYSLMVGGDKYNNSYTLFKGLRYNLHGVNDLVYKAGKMDQILYNNQTFNGYKFSVLVNFIYSGSSIKSDVLDSDGHLGTTSGIHIFLNEKYQNLLVIINQQVSALIPDAYNYLYTFNDQFYYDERGGYYTGVNRFGVRFYDYNPLQICAANFMNAVNDMNNKAGFPNYITSHYLDGDGNYGYTVMSSDTNVLSGNLNLIPNWQKNYPPFALDVEAPAEMKLKPNSYHYIPVKGPKNNIYTQYKIDRDEEPFDKSKVIDPLARLIELNEAEIKPRAIQHGEVPVYDKTIYRYNGPYEPIFQEVEVFDKTKYFRTSNGLFEQVKFPTTATFGEDTEDTVNHSRATWITDTQADLLGTVDNVGAACQFDLNVTTIPYNLPLGFVGPDVVVSNYHFNLPPDSTILDIKITLRQRSTEASTANYIYNSKVCLELADGTLLTNRSGASAHVYSGTTPLAVSNASGITTGDVTDGGWGIYTWHGTPSYWGWSAVTTDEFNDTAWQLRLGYTNRIQFPGQQYNYVELEYASILVSYQSRTIPTGTTFFMSYDRNLRFNTDLYQFGMMEELMFSKVNHVQNVLKIRNTEEDTSIYPMVDEFGYQYDTRFIFKSMWDKDYYYQCLDYNQSLDPAQGSQFGYYGSNSIFNQNN